MRKMRKTIIIALITFLCIGAGGYAWLRWKILKPEPLPAHNRLPGDSVTPMHAASPLDLRPKMIEKLNSLVLARSGGLYHLNIGELLPSLGEQELRMRNLVFEFDPAIARGRKDREFYRIRLDSLFIDGLGLKDILDRDNISLNSLTLYKPRIEIFQNGAVKTNADPKAATDKLLKTLGNFSLKTLYVKNGQVTVHNRNGKTNRFNDVAIVMRDILVDSTNQENRFLFSKSTSLSFANYSINLPGSPYILKVGKINLQAPANTAKFSGVSILSTITPAQFDASYKKQKEQYSIRISGVELSGVDWWDLSGSEGLQASQIVLNNPALEIYLNRYKDKAPPKKNSFPQQLLLNAKMKLDIASVQIRNMSVRYKELNPQSGKTGILQFTAMNGQISNLTNIPAFIAKNGKARLTMNGIFNRQLPINAAMSFDLRNKTEAPWTASLSSVKKVPMESLNSITEPLGMFRAKEGELQSLKANVSGNSKAGSGKVIPLYSNIKIHALEKNSKGETNPRHFSSLIANTFILKESNPKDGQEARTGQAAYTHDPSKSFMNLVWKTTLTGILDAVGAPAKLAE